MTTIPSSGDLDRADQSTFVRDADRDIGLDTTALHPLAEHIRDAFDSADIADRIDQAWITPYPDDYEDLVS